VAFVHERTIPTERPPVVGEVSANLLRIEGVAWSAQRIPTVVNLGFLDRSRYFSFQELQIINISYSAELILHIREHNGHTSAFSFNIALIIPLIKTGKRLPEVILWLKYAVFVWLNYYIYARITLNTCVLLHRFITCP
jgi:hypothetical protein